MYLKISPDLDKQNHANHHFMCFEILYAAPFLII